MEQNKITDKLGFIKKHPILFNFLLIILAAWAVVWITLIVLDVWTEHGKYEVVPNLHGLSYTQAQKALLATGLRAELSDSVYDNATAPGTVLEQSPRAKTKVKPNRVVYLTINAFSPKLVTVPALTDMSLRQARSVLEGLGIKNVRESYVDSEYKDLVLGAKFNGLQLKPGARIPATATVTIEVGRGIVADDDSLSDGAAEE
ncbi:PASTA domain-containing protein [uncultured Muribaculum sp.]|uniref:PASTA domain-containing protein n=1 Tax=uncultured Muribaculum sp. TaxID=1918613 RepID=UPI0025952266|nr:PASTA domain-containing protein [uncultured Muribaculum sp.]